MHAFVYRYSTDYTTVTQLTDLSYTCCSSYSRVLRAQLLQNAYGDRRGIASGVAASQ
jgi:hypothetical protein